ncbi:MAG TPA: glycoside hydrolase family 127 protein [Verrucomicrobiae bacterium]|nr:glycoside hydrolase family 127 protein [Verrucomicrobiae bacterium]
MKSSLLLRCAFVAVLLFCLFNLSAKVVSKHRDYPVQPVSFTDVHLTDHFWAPRIETNRLFTIPYAFQKCEESGRMYNFERAAAVLRGEKITDKKPPGYPFDDTDPYKVLEGASYAFAVQPDPKLDAYLDKLIALIASAQEPDGYLYTTRTIDPEHPHPWAGKQRWVNEEQLSHELYNAGHLFEAAAAHYQSTGKTNLLDVALKEADLLCKTFGPATNQLHLWPGHEVVEMGLAKLYRVTGEQKYLDLAKYFIDVRGSYPGGDDYHQSRIPPVQQTEAIGHAVRAGYLYSGMADVAALTGDKAYVHAIDTIWSNCVDKKIYLTGGIGARHSGEAFGANYELPNLTAYNETCAAVANDYWNSRLFLLHGDAKYMDVFERTLYNGLLSGVSLDGKTFFYPNPLECKGDYARSPWFGCACCPGNITRFLPSVPGYFYAQQGEKIFVNLYASGTANIKLENGRAIKLTQQTEYPWDGKIKITVAPDENAKFIVAVRIPGWARGEPIPGNLYRFADDAKPPITLAVNGKSVPIKLDQGYVNVNRQWKSGDVIELNLPMPVREVVANENVAADRGRIALQRGPIVFCAEWPDNPNGKVCNLILPEDQKFSAQFEPQLLNGVETISGKAFATSTNADGKIEETEQEFKAIPYFAWANRGKGEMNVWFADSMTNAPTNLTSN